MKAYGPRRPSVEEEGVNLAHGPGQGRKSTGSGYSRALHKANTSRFLQVQPRAELQRQRKHKAQKHDRDTEMPVGTRSRSISVEELARRARSDLFGHHALGSGRRDPFNAYPHQDSPVFVHEIIDYILQETMKALANSDKPADLKVAATQLGGEIMNDDLTWHSVIMAGIVHSSFMRGHTKIPLTERLLRLSYFNKVIGMLNEDIKANSGVPSDSGLMAMASIVVANGATGTEHPFLYDKVQTRKAFGKANDVQYYSSQEMDYTHWTMLVKFLRLRGGIASISSRFMLMPGLLANADSLTAWSRLRKPLLDPIFPTGQLILVATHQPDEIANEQMRTMLSGLPVGFRTCPELPYATLYGSMQHTRTLTARYMQWERRTEQGWRPDLRLIFLTRLLLMHDFLSLDSVETDGTGLPMTFEMSRHACFAFMQLVLYPIAHNNDMPNRLLKVILPLLRLARARLREARRAPLGRENRDMDGGVNSGLFSWMWMLAGMLALEHLQTKESSDWMDKVAPFVADMPVKAEKASWPLVKATMRTFLWLDSECDPQGQQWWNFACLWLQARRRENEPLQQGATSSSQWSLDTERRQAAVPEIPVIEID